MIALDSVGRDGMATGREWKGARLAFWAVLVVGLGVALTLNLPGHLTFDSVVALHEGRFHERNSWNPPFYSWLLGETDGLVAGTAAYVALSIVLLFAAWGALAFSQRRVSWLAPVVAALIILTPAVLIYQGIVWKDVFFANAAIVAFACLALAARQWPARPPWLLLSLAALMLAVAALVRQNGVVLWPCAIAAVAVSVRPRRPAIVTRWTLGWLALVVGLFYLLGATALPQGVGRPDGALGVGVRSVQQYDLVGAAARDPVHPFAAIAAVNPQAVHAIHELARDHYSPVRIDTLGDDPTAWNAIWGLPAATVQDAWLGLIVDRPGVYLKTRLAAFEWVFATPEIDRCLPLVVGVSGPPDMLKDLHMTTRNSPADARLLHYGAHYLKTPVLSHVAYAGVAIFATALLLWRGEPPDLAVAAMLAGALLFTASFFVISIACDYRYLYFLDIAALTSLIYLALTPRLRQRSHEHRRAAADAGDRAH